MDFLRKKVSGWKLSAGEEPTDDETSLPVGPTIGISAGQVREDVHYMESRGDIDLSFLRFHAFDPNAHIYGNLNNYYNNQHGDNYYNDSSNSNRNFTNGHGYENSGSRVETFVDIAVFEVPDHCTSRNCDLSKFGVGDLSHFNGGSYSNLCKAGRLNLDHSVFKGHHTQLMVPIEGPMQDRIKQRKTARFSGTKERHYEVVLANCHRHGRNVRVNGQVVFDLVETESIANNLTRGSAAILSSVALVVFLALSVVAVRVRLGTRSDFERELYGLVPSTDDDGDVAGDGEPREPTEVEDQYEDDYDERGAEPGAGSPDLAQANTRVV